MSICQTVQDWMPWYVSGHLEATKMGRLARHIDSCEACQKELAHVIQLRHQFALAVDATPVPIDRVWDVLSPTLDAPKKARIDVGSFLIGVHFAIAADNQRMPVQGNLKVLGHKVQIIGRRKKGA
ncbi:zf-HC2 domain-containing protein [Candidatus Bipolaricaulota bacterium]|nr:zf-HC2 domain-containing protein [Candidatus Bipolaricaulota bacterium]